MMIEGADLGNSPALPQLGQLASKDTMMIPAGTLVEQIARLLGIAADNFADILARLIARKSFDALQSQFSCPKKSVDGGRVEQRLGQTRDQGKLTPDLEEWATQPPPRDFTMFRH
jgi:phage I-like protein